MFFHGAKQESRQNCSFLAFFFLPQFLSLLSCNLLKLRNLLPVEMIIFKSIFLENFFCSESFESFFSQSALELCVGASLKAAS